MDSFRRATNHVLLGIGLLLRRSHELFTKSILITSLFYKVTSKNVLCRRLPMSLKKGV